LQVYDIYTQKDLAYIHSNKVIIFIPTSIPRVYILM